MCKIKKKTDAKRGEVCKGYWIKQQPTDGK